MKNLLMRWLVDFKSKTIDCFIGLLIGIPIMYCMIYVTLNCIAVFIDLFRY